MAIIALFIGVVLIVAAIRNSQGALASQLIADVPGFVVWAAAIVAVGLIGTIPALKPFSRGLLILIVVVLLLNNYQAILAGFSGAVKSGQVGGTAASPSSSSSSDPFAFLQSFGLGSSSSSTGGSFGAPFIPEIGNVIGSGASIGSGA